MVIEIIPHIERNKDTFGHVLNHSPIEWIVENYPLSYAQVYAALAYYYDHQAEIDRMMADKADRERAITQQLPTLDDLRAKIAARGSK